MPRHILHRTGSALLVSVACISAVLSCQAARQTAEVGDAERGRKADAVTPLDSLGACRAALAFTPEKRIAPFDEPLRVMSWNAMKFSRPGSRAILDRLSDHVDVLLLQEALRSEGPREGDPQRRYFADGYVTWSDEQTGVELRSRYAADTVCTLSFTEPWLRSPKAVIATRLPFAGQSLLVVNLHAINFTFTARAYREQLAAIGDLLAAHGGPAIVAGDLNNWNAGRHAALEDFARENGLSIASFEPDWRSRHIGVPVDGLLQRGFVLLDAAALPTAVSDHHPLILLLERPRATPPSQQPPARDVARAAAP